MGSVIKVIVIYHTPFWREGGYSGEAISSTGPISICYDDTSHDDKRHAIVGFIAGQDARDWVTKPAEERQKAILKQYARFWGDKALVADIFLEKYWKDEEYTRGCYLGVWPPGLMTATKTALYTPIDRIHWAGTETASKWYGYMEGACDSAIRVSQEVITLLSKGKTPSKL